ncbi:MAG: hypothetical protein IJY54_05395 [Paludibacteraceae bacterium]|nr:hypothetical protein [Paludibacteraceae bacterium]
MKKAKKKAKYILTYTYKGLGGGETLEFRSKSAINAHLKNINAEDIETVKVEQLVERYNIVGLYTNNGCYEKNMSRFRNRINFDGFSRW